MIHKLPPGLTAGYVPASSEDPEHFYLEIGGVLRHCITPDPDRGLDIEDFPLMAAISWSNLVNAPPTDKAVLAIASAWLEALDAHTHQAPPTVH